ncbi:hypothetical protein DUNSADRAFT_855 [Dunaliella salina]|uniref:TmcB/TmcC TPR repeats domain-containing protein n=1 Tax=Dunaliella salina TaxID=3046 RepID=A0ABQ7FY89_DUNSA|nr:hypothetical protein DUNSADRAFT_855 [Dunaliella salina]|eukprot:KAF5827330.1 hypothetical protein DUNSADRAFT_855 [Dunaliella salina]
MKPNIITRYQIFVVSEKAKRLRSASEGHMDLQSYVEFKRNYRSLARVHRKALKAQRDFWKLFMHSSTKVGTVRAQLAELEAVAERAQYAYRRIMERYPNNGKVLKCYGKFLEEVKNDVSGATRHYTEGNRIGTTDAMMNM